jgi:hypothetical protein
LEILQRKTLRGKVLEYVKDENGAFKLDNRGRKILIKEEQEKRPCESSDTGSEENVIQPHLSKR